VVIRPVQPGDVEALRVMAATNHDDTRFFHDRHFPRERSRELYARWIEKSCHGAAAAVLVAERQGQLLGYLTMLQPAPGCGQIGLCGVAPTARGMGLGRALVAEAQRWFHGQGLMQATVVTQGRNLNATRLYERSGFITEHLQLWFHRWFEPAHLHPSP
jgi:ribosomal protein S18 acetylase RimI-like enzyme